MALPTAARAQADATYTAVQRAEISAVPLTMELSRRVYGVTTDMLALVKTDPKIKKLFFATMGSSFDETVRVFAAEPKIASLVRTANFASVRDFEIANVAFVTAYSVGNAYPGEQLDPQHLTSPAQVAFIRAHQADLTKLMARMPLMVPHTSAPD